MFAAPKLDPAQMAPAQIVTAQLVTARAVFGEMLQSWRAVARRSEAVARAEGEEQVFNQMVVALAGWFSHRPDGVPAMQELGLLAQGITAWNGFFPQVQPDEWQPEASITGYAPGDRIRICEQQFARLADACLQGIAARING